MPERALRPASLTEAIREAIRGLNDPNARKGIKTTLPPVRVGGTGGRLNDPNARKGIKTGRANHSREPSSQV